MSNGVSIVKAIKIPSKMRGDDMSKQRNPTVRCELSPEQYENLVDLADNGLYPVRRPGERIDPDRVYEFASASHYLRHLIKKDYESRTGEYFGDDPQVGNPNFS